MKNQLITLTLSLILAAPALAGAGSIAGNGGDGVYMNGRLYLLDLVETNSQENAFIGTERSTAKTEQILATALAKIPVDRELLSRKIQDVAKLSTPVATLVLAAIQRYSWNLVAFPLVNVEDEDTLVSLPLQQIAIRRKGQILVNQDLFGKLDAKNRVALVMHEAVYAVIKPVSKSFQPSSEARRINEYLFQADATNAGLEKAAELFGTQHKFLPVSGLRGSVADLRKDTSGVLGFPIEGEAHIYTRWARRDSGDDAASFENKMSDQGVSNRCEYGGGLGPKNQYTLPTEVTMIVTRRRVSITEGTLYEGATYLAWELTSAPDLKPGEGIIDIPVGSFATCRANLIKQLQLLSAYLKD